MDAFDGRLVAGVDVWLFDELLLDVRLKPNDQRSSSSAGQLAVCGRADGRDVEVEGMLRRSSGKSVRYTGELVVPDHLEAVGRHLQIHGSQWQFSAPNFAPGGAGSS